MIKSIKLRSQVRDRHFKASRNGIGVPRLSIYQSITHLIKTNLYMPVVGTVNVYEVQGVSPPQALMMVMVLPVFTFHVVVIVFLGRSGIKEAG
jgi:hypothetical protein